MDLALKTVTWSHTEGLHGMSVRSTCSRLWLALMIAAASGSYAGRAVGLDADEALTLVKAKWAERTCPIDMSLSIQRIRRQVPLQPGMFATLVSWQERKLLKEMRTAPAGHMEGLQDQLERLQEGTALALGPEEERFTARALSDGQRWRREIRKLGDFKVLPGNRFDGNVD